VHAISAHPRLVTTTESWSLPATDARDDCSKFFNRRDDLGGAPRMRIPEPPSGRPTWCGGDVSFAE
jgi:hypothetical protein